MNLYKYAATSTVFFWKPDAPNGHFSQWFMSPFELDGVQYCCAIQAVMAEKARMFKDTDMETKIMKSRSPKTMRYHGRRVRNFDETRWSREREALAVRVNMAKFSQSPRLLELLLETGRGRIVYASPSDKVWGIGMKETHDNALFLGNWRGQNLLGKALQTVRQKLRDDSLLPDVERFRAVQTRVHAILKDSDHGYRIDTYSLTAELIDIHPFDSLEIGLGETQYSIMHADDTVSVYPHTEVDAFVAHVNKLIRQ
jgi:ribA/ribD-fused uncharacterized protein